MATKLKSADIVIVGLGWTGGILAKELADTGLSIVVLERGAPRDTNPDFMYPIIHDELRYAQRHQLMQDVSRETVTFRNNANETALPMRQLGSFLPGEGVGGAGVHWNGATWRWLPWDHEPLKLTLGSYGRSVIPPDMQLQDWGVSYDELEHYYDKFEYLCGVSGKAGNLRGQKIEGGNVFEGARQREYPNPPMIQTHAGALFDKAAKSLGYHPFPGPSANMSQPYVNPDGVAFGTCHYCGYCERFGCEVNAKASAHFTVIPLAAQKNNVEMRTNARVMKVNLDTAKTRAESVTYIDAAGREFEQPGDLVVLCAYALGNVHLMLLSGIGKPYNPATGDGVIGRNYAYQIGSGATVFFDEKTWMNPFMGAGALAVNIDDFNTGSFDHAKEGFIGGGGISTPSAGGRPIGFRPVPPGTPAWGTEWKRAVVRHYNHALAINNQGSVMAYRQNYLDLDFDLSRSLRPTAAAHDIRLSCQRAEAGKLHCRYLREDRAGDGCRARRAARVTAALQHRPLSKHAQHRGRGNGDRSEDQRAQSLLSDLGRVECVRHRGMRFSAKRRQESNRPCRRARLLDRGCHQALPEEAGTAGAGIETFGTQSRRWRPLLIEQRQIFHQPSGQPIAKMRHYRCYQH